MSDRAIRYIEAGEREPSVDAIQKIAAALGVTTDYFMDDATFQKELSDDQFYADVRKKYGSRGVAQAKKIKEQTSALFAGGELSEEDQANFYYEMEAFPTQKKRQKVTLKISVIELQRKGVAVGQLCYYCRRRCKPPIQEQ